MKRTTFTTALAGVLAAGSLMAQFDPTIQPDFTTKTVMVPKSPLKYQVLFVGGVDQVQTVNNQGQPNGQTAAKQWHDFIGFTPDNTGSGDLGWVSVNHEMVWNDDKIGDGGGMTVFKIRRNNAADTIVLVPQNLPDGRQGTFFNVDFVNTVGETGMNCGGITSTADGRIWTAEEWFRTSNTSIYVGNNAPFDAGGPGKGVRDTTDWVIDTDIQGDFDGKSIRRFQNFNWMVEIDPKTAKAVRKQYNWGRQGFEGGCILPDNRTVFLGEDDTPGLFSKFVANTPGDFTSGKLFVYKENAGGATGNWVEVNSGSLDDMLNIKARALAAGATVFNRVEWVVYDKVNNKVYLTETGRDDIGTRFANRSIGGYWAKVWRERNPSFAGTDAAALDSVRAGAFRDFYGRVLVYDVATDKVDLLVEGGPFLATSPNLGQYPATHLTNPDGLGMMYINNKAYLFIQEDLNGTSFGRVPNGITEPMCEMYILDLSKTPSRNELKRVTMTPEGAEITGVCAIDDNTILVNSQHPNAENPFPYNNSLTFAISGWRDAVTSIFEEPEFSKDSKFSVWPNPATRVLHFNVTTDVALYDASGNRVMVQRNVDMLDVSRLSAGVYFVRTADGDTQKIVIQ